MSAGGRAHGPGWKQGSFRCVSRSFPTLLGCASSCLSSLVSKWAPVNSSRANFSGSGCRLLLWMSGPCTTSPRWVWASKCNPQIPSVTPTSQVLTKPCYIHHQPLSIHLFFFLPPLLPSVSFVLEVTEGAWPQWPVLSVGIWRVMQRAVLQHPIPPSLGPWCCVLHRSG